MSPVPILMYHSIDNLGAAPYRRWVVSPERFGRQMAVLAAGRYWPLTMQELAECLARHRPLPPRSIAITFDDGLGDFASNALPVLEHFGYKATLFVVAGRVGKTADWLEPLGEGQRPMLDWATLRDLAARGIEIGAHTMSHPQLDILPPALARQEIFESKAVLEGALAHPIRAFAYPHGYASPAIRALVAAAGFNTACRVRHALSATSENRFALSRIIMTEDVSDAGLATLLGGHGLPVAPPVDRLVSSGWRWIRRVDHAIQPTVGPAWRRGVS